MCSLITKNFESHFRKFVITWSTGIFQLWLGPKNPSYCFSPTYLPGRKEPWRKWMWRTSLLQDGGAMIMPTIMHVLTKFSGGLAQWSEIFRGAPESESKRSEAYRAVFLTPSAVILKGGLPNKGLHYITTRVKNWEAMIRNSGVSSR